jgi:hypothetical protein
MLPTIIVLKLCPGSTISQILNRVNTWLKIVLTVEISFKVSQKLMILIGSFAQLLTICNV